MSGGYQPKGSGPAPIIPTTGSGVKPTPVTEQSRDQLKADGRPYEYDLTDPKELLRLYRETSGYLRTCRHHHHGTDFAGRQFAIKALTQLADGAA